MTALAANVNSSETLWEVDAVPDPEFGFYTVGSEIVQVTAGFPSSTGYAHGEVFPSKIRVIRGTNDTTAASHLSGAALTAANAFSGGGGGGGAGVPTLLGPYHIAWDTPLIHADDGDFLGAHLATLTEGDLILRAYTFVTAVWDGAQVLQLNLGNADVAGDEGLFTIEHLNLSTSNVPPVPTVYFGEASGGFVFPPGPRGAIVGPDCDLLAQIADTAATQGTADIYLLVVTLA